MQDPSQSIELDSYLLPFDSDFSGRQKGDEDSSVIQLVIRSLIHSFIEPFLLSPPQVPRHRSVTKQHKVLASHSNCRRETINR